MKSFCIESPGSKGPGLFYAKHKDCPPCKASRMPYTAAKIILDVAAVRIHTSSVGLRLCPFGRRRIFNGLNRRRRSQRPFLHQMQWYGGFATIVQSTHVFCNYLFFALQKTRVCSTLRKQINRINFIR